MDISLHLSAVLIGLAVAAPTGPVALLCIRKSIEYGVLGGFSVGLGSALADMVYAVCAYGGLGMVSSLLTSHHSFLKITSSLFLIGLGLRELWQGAPEGKMRHTGLSHNLLLKGFFLTLSNPLAILIFMGIFSTWKLFSLPSHDSVILFLGIFLGALLWWGFLSKIATHFSSMHIRWMRWLCCALLLGCGFWSLIF